MLRAVFIDRDGTVSEEIGYMYHSGLYRPFPFAGPAIRKINESGMKAVLITNQSGVGRGYFNQESVDEVHGILTAELERHQAALDAIYVCPHQPQDNCECRKPNPGMLLRAQEELDIDLHRSYVVGDKFVDIEAAHRVGARGILVLTGYGQEEREANQSNPVQPDLVAENLMDAVERILADEG